MRTRLRQIAVEHQIRTCAKSYDGPIGSSRSHRAVDASPTLNLTITLPEPVKITPQMSILLGNFLIATGVVIATGIVAGAFGYLITRIG